MTYPVLHTSPVAPLAYLARRGLSPGGPAPARGVWVPPINGDSSAARMPGSLLDGAIGRERMPWLHDGTRSYTAPADLVSWSGQAPARPSLAMRNVTQRRMAGTSNTRAQDPIPSGPGIQDGTGAVPGGSKALNYAGVTIPTNTVPHGLHTRVRGSKAQSTTRYLSGAAQMRAGRQNRLSNSVRQGYSYSQTTAHQGAPR